MKKIINGINVLHFAEKSADYTAGATDLDTVMESIRAISYHRDGLGRAIDAAHSLSDEFNKKTLSAFADIITDFSIIGQPKEKLSNLAN